MNALTLDRLRELISYNPWHWNGLENSFVPVTSECNAVVKQFAWQAQDAAGRSEIDQAITRAENKLTDHLKFAPGEKYLTEIVSIPCLLHWGNCGPAFSYYRQVQSLRLKSGLVKTIGTETWAALGTPETITVTDEDGDGLMDWFSATITDSTADPDNVAIAWLAADVAKADQAITENRFIRPVTITRTGVNTLEATGPAWVLIKPKLYQGFSKSPNGLDPNNLANYPTQIQFYLKTLSAENTATLSYYNSAGVLTTATLNAFLCDAESGIVNLSLDNCLSICLCNQYKQSQSVTINYRAGADINDWDYVIAYLAIAELRRRICACESANKEIWAWQLNLAFPVEPGMARISLDPGDLANPLGTCQGQIHAWHKVQMARIVRGISA